MERSATWTYVRQALADCLSRGPAPAAKVENFAREFGWPHRTLHSAARSLGVNTYELIWRLPDCVIPFTRNPERAYSRRRYAVSEVNAA